MPIEWSFPSFNGHCQCYLLAFPIVFPNIAVIRSAANMHPQRSGKQEQREKQLRKH